MSLFLLTQKDRHLSEPVIQTLARLMLLSHMQDGLTNIRVPTVDEPLRVLVSGCLGGWKCGVDGTDNGFGNRLAYLLNGDLIEPTYFCPEQFAIGTPRTTPDIHGGDGFDVLRGSAKVLDENNVDLTEKMIIGAEAMAAHAIANRSELAILMDMSAACGSQVISDGCRFAEQRKYRKGVGVATAALIGIGIPVVSQRDYRTLVEITLLVDPNYVADGFAINHHETKWFREYFGESA